MHNRLNIFSAIEENTGLESTSNNKLQLMLSDSKAILAKKELVLRVLNKKLNMRPVALSICNNELKQHPYHNFFNLAYAMLTEDDTERESAFYQAIHAKEAVDSTIPAQAAYQFARYYIEKEEYLLSQVWLVCAIMKGNTRALADFLTRGSAKAVDNLKLEQSLFNIANPGKTYEGPNRFMATVLSSSLKQRINLLLTMATVIILNKNRKMEEYLGALIYSSEDDEFNLSDKHIDGFRSPYSWISDATYSRYIYYRLLFASNNQNPVTELNNPDGNLHWIASYTVGQSASIFYHFIEACFQNNVLPETLREDILHFLKTYAATSKNQAKEMATLLIDGNTFNKEQKLYLSFAPTLWKSLPTIPSLEPIYINVNSHP